MAPPLRENRINKNFGESSFIPTTILQVAINLFVKIGHFNLNGYGETFEIKSAIFKY